MRRIGSIEAENFKSLVNFEITLAQFSCLIGLNGSGKSTVLQFIDFLSQLVQGDMKAWLGARKWKATDLKSKLTNKKNIEFCVRFCDGRGAPAGRWEAVYNPTKRQCMRERLDLLDYLLEADKDEVSVLALGSGNSGFKNWRADITFDYEGSILSALKEDRLPPSIRQCKHSLAGIKSLDLLAPEHLRQRSRSSSGTLGRGGQNLSAFLHEMTEHQRAELFFRLRQAYPQLLGFSAKANRSGWKEIEISESYEGPKKGLFPSMTTEARHINDGLLRLLAILAELHADNQFLLFDEIENGINPELVEFVLQAIVNSPKQVMVTTHSPMILNYLDDDVARQGVIYLYKTPAGHTQSIPFFSIPSLAEKLTVMGPGEAFADTNLSALGEEINLVAEGR